MHNIVIISSRSLAFTYEEIKIWKIKWFSKGWIEKKYYLLALMSLECDSTTFSIVYQSSFFLCFCVSLFFHLELCSKPLCLNFPGVVYCGCPPGPCLMVYFQPVAPSGLWGGSETPGGVIVKENMMPQPLPGSLFPLCHKVRSFSPTEVPTKGKWTSKWRKEILQLWVKEPFLFG